MTASLQTLIEPQAVPAVSTLFFTATAATSFDAVTLYNALANAACKVTINWVPNAGAVAASNVICEHTVLPGEVYPVFALIGHILNPGDKIYAIAATGALVNLFASGTVNS